MAHNAKFGIALDIGTSKLEGALVDLASLKIAATENRVNSQASFGHDIISRLNFAISKDAGQEDIREIQLAKAAIAL